LCIVQHDDEVAARVPGVVEPLVRQPAAERAVAEDRGDLEVVAVEVASGGHAEGGRDGRARVPGAEGIVRALGPLEEAGQAVLLAQRVEAVAAAGEQLVRVALVPHVPDELIARGLEHVMQRDGELDDAERRADVPARARAAVDEERAHLRGELAELVAREPLQVGRRADAPQDGVGHAIRAEGSRGGGAPAALPPRRAGNLRRGRPNV
jgi:hypothetical protein